MTEKVLVAYASKYGSTREVAEAVAGVLEESGLTVDLIPARKVSSLEGYSAVVLGAPLYILRWHKDALRFLSRNQKALAGMPRHAPRRLPVAVFALGPFNDKEEEWQEVRGELDKELARFPWLEPVAVEVFGGKFDPAALTFPWNLVPAMKAMPPSDIRDWDRIRDWAAEIRPALLPERSAETAA